MMSIRVVSFSVRLAIGEYIADEINTGGVPMPVWQQAEDLHGRKHIYGCRNTYEYIESTTEMMHNSAKMLKQSFRLIGYNKMHWEELA